MEPLAKMALEASGYRQTEDGWVKDGESQLDFYPPHLEKTYFHWLSNIRD